MRDFAYWKIPERMDIVPCLECGSDDLVLYNPWGLWHVLCRGCGNKSKAMDKPCKAIRAWNYKCASCEAKEGV